MNRGMDVYDIARMCTRRIAGGGAYLERTLSGCEVSSVFSCLCSGRDASSGGRLDAFSPYVTVFLSVNAVASLLRRAGSIGAAEGRLYHMSGVGWW